MKSLNFKTLLQAILLAMILLAIMLFASSCKKADTEYNIEILIGVSQANTSQAWRLQTNEELKRVASLHKSIRLVFTDAANNSQKQIDDINKLMAYGIDLLIISPNDSVLLYSSIAQVYNKIPVIVMDRAIDGFDYSLFIGPDNEQVGRLVAQKINEINTNNGGVLEIISNSIASAERSKSLRQYLNPNTNIIKTKFIDKATSDKAEDYIYNNTGLLSKVNVIFAHTEDIAVGVSRALQKLENNSIQIISIDGFLSENNKTNINATIVCPTGGTEAIGYALDILNKVSGVPKKVILRSQTVTSQNINQYAKLLNGANKKHKGKIMLGYVQVGTESGWRIANNNSIIQASKDRGLDLVVMDANQSQQKQIEIIQKYIDMRVDVIALSPVVETGWDGILKKAKQAGIPVLLSDRGISTENEDLYTCYIGGDFFEEGQRAAKWLIENGEADNINILEIQGTKGATPSIERKKGFENKIKGLNKYNVVYSASGDFTYAGGYKIVSEYLASKACDFDVIYAHNDDMALGAIKALEERGISPGNDVKIISIDGISEALKAVQDGKINCVVECTPLLGPELIKAVEDLLNGRQLPLRIITDEMVFTKNTPKQYFKNRKY